MKTLLLPTLFGKLDIVFENQLQLLSKSLKDFNQIWRGSHVGGPCSNDTSETNQRLFQ